MRYIRDNQAGLWVDIRRCRYTRKGVLPTPLKMPVAPLDEFGWDTTYGWSDYDTISEGQFSRPSGRQLRTLNLSTIALDYIAPWAVTQEIEQGESLINPARRERLARLRRQLDDTSDPVAKRRIQERIQQIITQAELSADRDLIDEDSWGDAQEVGPWGIARQLDRLVTQGTPVRIIVRNPALPRADVNMVVTVRSANLRERAGEPDARYFDLSFSEYRAPKIARRNYGEHQLPAQVYINQNGVAFEYRDQKRVKQNTGGTSPPAIKHTIGSTLNPPTLRDLSRHFYGTSNKWRLIQKRNRGLLQGFSGEDLLKDVYDRRKRKNKPLRLNIPEADWEPGKGAKQAKRGGGILPF